MKQVLTIEVKDNKTVATLAKVKNGNIDLLMHNTYGSKPLSTHHHFDEQIAKNIKADLREINFINDIDETYLIVNSQDVTISTYDFDFRYNEDIEVSKERVKNKIIRDNPSVHISHLLTLVDDQSLTKKSIRTILEASKKDYIQEIRSAFYTEGIVFTKVIPVLQAIKNSVIDKTGDTDSIVSILVEEKFTQLTWITKGVITSSVKWSFGLTNIYEYISAAMKISKPEAKGLFKSFGSIPPSSVVDDKIIHSNTNGKETEIFTKKKLSEFITEKVQDLFANVLHHIEGIKQPDEQIGILFTGEIQALTGFKKFASTSFEETNIQKYNTDIIGLEPESEFITMGALLEVEDVYEDKKEHLYKPKNSFFEKLFRMYNYI